MELTKAERLILYMLADISEHLKIPNSIDPAFLREVISGGHDWALDWELPGVFPQEVDSEESVRFVTDTLDMWSFIEHSFGELDEAGKGRVKEDAKLYGDPVFAGFDGNNEPGLISIARLFVEHMDRFHYLKGRGLNSHHPTVAKYRAMLEVYAPIRPVLADRSLNADELIQILSAKGY